jgi:GH15 family glucan-1,4-alpha-glucosidase
MSKKRYPGIGVLGGDQISALYGVNNGIVDWQGVGIQHLFYGTYEVDLVHSGVTFLRHQNGVVELGNRKCDGKRHPVHQSPTFSEIKDGFLYRTGFTSQENPNVCWVEEVYANEENKVIFETTVSNKGDEPITLELGGYVILRNPGGGKTKKQGDGVLWQGKNHSLAVSMEEVDTVTVTIESPTGFVYRTLQQLFTNQKNDQDELETKHSVGTILHRKVTIAVGEKYKVRWGLAAGASMEGMTNPFDWNWDKEHAQAYKFWRNWLDRSSVKNLSLPPHVIKHYEANLTATKGAILGGFVPADITGHYFSFGSPCYYARDAMMIARSFLLSGYDEEAKAIMEYLIHRPTKNDRGEFYQRYNAKGEPSEGANNDVPHQLDSQGYFLRNLLTYYERTGEWLLPYEEIKPYADVLFDCQGINQLMGPEGGVNEGVFGPAFITSSNMFIYGGLMAASRIAEVHGDYEKAKEWKGLSTSIDEGIQTTWIEEEGRYGYGYVVYDSDVVHKYDTPQYFGPLYGYPLHDRLVKNNRFLLKYASFFEHGIGYTEQEYHHGPWMFNTGACAQFQALINASNEYVSKIEWMMEHSNGYGLMPEAIDAQDEDHAFINPLTWACAEFVSSISILVTKDGFVDGRLKITDEIWKEG